MLVNDPDNVIFTFYEIYYIQNIVFTKSKDCSQINIEFCTFNSTFILEVVP